MANQTDNTAPVDIQGKTWSTNIGKAFSIVIILLVVVVLYITSLKSYLLFHAFIEISSIIIACSVFLLVWNGRSYIEDSYFVLLGIAYFFVSCIDLSHTFAYRGMGFFNNESNIATQLWIGARYIQSLSLLAACFFVRKRLNIYIVFLIYSVISIVLLLSIFHWRVFPTCYVEGEGLTTFKIVSEYIISAILITAIFFLYRIRSSFDTSVFKLLVGSILLTVCSEIAFTKYVSVFGLSNQIGHYLKLAAFFLVYRAIIVTGVVTPHTLLFNNLRQREKTFKESAERLEKEVKERVKIEEQLAKSHLTLNQMFNGTADGIRVVGKDYSVLRVNESFLELIDVPEDQAYRLKCHELFSGDECFSESCTLNQILSGKEAVEIETRKIGPDGETRTVHMIAKPYRDVNGELLGMIESFKDISKSKEMERTIKEERDLFIEGFVVVLKWKNKTGWPIDYVSPNVQRVLGYSVEEMTGTDFLYMDIIDKKDQTRVAQKKINAIKAHREHEEHEPYRIRDASGNHRWILDHTRFVTNADGEVDYFYGYLLDVSNYKAIEERLENQAKLAHAGRLTSLGEMASGMAHELNQPLTVIRLAADSLKSISAMEKRSEVEEEAVNDIINQVKRAARIIKNMRAFSQSDSLGHILVDLTDPIENALSFFKEQFRTHEIMLNIDLAQNLPNALLDPQKFEQIVVNFLSNARYAVEAKKEYASSNYEMVVSVRTRLDKTSNQIVFEVEDNGISMTPDVVDRCMEPFFTKKDVGEGTGLGLSIVNSIAREFGMTVDIDILEGKGCLFRVSVPVQEPA